MPFPIPDITPPETKIYLVCTIYITKTKTPRQLGKNVLKLENMHRAILLLKKIPKGKVTTYKSLALELKTKAYRAVGNAMNRNPFAPQIPCHRVVKSNGEIGGFASGTKNKIKMLNKEGIKIQDGKIDLEKYEFNFR